MVAREDVVSDGEAGVRGHDAVVRAGDGHARPAGTHTPTTTRGHRQREPDETTAAGGDRVWGLTRRCSRRPSRRASTWPRSELGRRRRRLACSGCGGGVAGVEEEEREREYWKGHASLRCAFLHP